MRRGADMVAEALPNQRGAFEIPENVACLNAAFMGPQARETAEAGQEALRARVRP